MDTLKRKAGGGRRPEVVDRRPVAKLALAKNRLAFAHALLSDQPVASPVAELVERELLQSIAEDKFKDRTLAGHTNWVKSVCEVGGMLASGSGDNTVKLWDVGSGTCVKTLAGHTNLVYSVCAVGGMLASGSDDNTVKLWPTLKKSS